MFRDKRDRFAILINGFFRGLGVVVVGLGGVGGREEGIGESVFLDQVLRHDKEELSPYFSDSMDTPVARLVEGLVGRRVDGRVGRVGEVSDSSDVVGGPSAHRVDVRSVPTD